MNRKMIRISGMARSGIHAVAEWIRMSHAEEGYSCHYDNNFSLEHPNNLAKFLPPSGDKVEPFLWMIEHEDILFVDMPVLSPKIFKNFDFVDVLVIRDAYNTMASRRKLNENMFSRRVLQQWKQFACEALDQTNFLGPNKIVVNFNSWAKDPFVGGYREEIAKKFELAGIGSATEKISATSSWEPNQQHSSRLQLF